MWSSAIVRFIEQLFPALRHTTGAYGFIRQNRVWEGYMRHTWISKITVLVAVILSFQFFRVMINLLTGAYPKEEAGTGLMTFFTGFEHLSNRMLLSGGIKYIYLILLEMMIFHVSVKTLEVLTGKEIPTTLNQFIDAQVRMIKVSIRNWIFELLCTILIAIALGILGLSSVKYILIGLLQFYLLGFAFIDNYSEMFGLSIKMSSRLVFKHIGAAVVIGLTAYVLFMIPGVGPILAPFICAVAATTYLYKNETLEEFTVLHNETIQ